MIRPLARAAALVEQLAAAGAAGLALREAAALSGLPPATATRLLHDLCALGWADQQGERGRYRLGPRLEALAGRRAYRGRLQAAATPVLQRLAQRLGANVVLAVLRGPHRLALLELGEDRGARLQERHDLYASASGRMLVAQLAWAARRRLVATIGLPQRRQWAEAIDWQGLNAACAEARRCGFIINDPPGLWTGVGVPVPDDEGGVAAIGVAVVKAHWSAHIVDAATRAAVALSRRLAGGA